MTERTKRYKRIVASVLAFVVAIGIFMTAIKWDSFQSQAIYDDSKAITFEELNGKNPVPSKYFFVGTYVFSLDSITDEIYSKALQSQSDFNQFNQFYKSELADGSWYDMTDATDLKDITASGTPLEEKEDVNPLLVTVFIDADGKAYDAATLSQVSLYDQPDPYDLSQIPELKTLHTMYESMYSEDSRGVDEFYYMQLKQFFATDFRKKYPSIGAQTEVLDTRMKNLQAGYEGLQEEGKTDQADVIDSLMKKVDNERRALIYKQLAVEGIPVAKPASTPTSFWASLTKKQQQQSYEEDDYELNMLVTILSNKSINGSNDIEDMEEIEQSTMPYDAWTNSKKQYTYDQIYQYMVNHDGIATVEDNDDNDVQVDPNLLMYLEDTPFAGSTSDKEVFKQNDSIISTIYDADSDCKYTYNELTGEDTSDPESHIGAAIAKVEQEIYEEAANGYSDTLITLVERLVRLNSIADNVVKEKEEELALINEDIFAECENGFKAAATGGVGTAYTSAQSQGANEDGLEAALEEQDGDLNQEMIELQFMITAKKMRISAKLCFQQTLQWIDWTEGLQALVPADAFSSRAKIAISTHKAWLMDLLKQLAEEDASLQSELDKLLAQKEKLNTEKMSLLDQNDINGAKKVDAKLAEIDQRIDKEVAKNTSTLQNENASASEKAVAAVGLNGSTTGAIENLKQSAYTKLSNGEDASNELGALKELGAEDALSELGAEDFAGEQDGSGDGSGNGDGAFRAGILSENDIMAILENVLGGPFDSLSAEGKVIAAVAVDRYGELGNVTAQNIAKNLIEICAKERNKYVYDTYTDGGKEFVNLKTLGKASAYRYVYSSGGKSGTLANGKDAYSFANNDAAMRIEATKKSSKMPAKAVFKNSSLYIPEATVKEYFAHTAESIDKANYSAILNASMESKASEVLDALKNGGN